MEESEEGGFTAKALAVSIYTESETMERLRAAVRGAVKCYFDDDLQCLIRLHMVKEEVFAG